MVKNKKVHKMLSGRKWRSNLMLTLMIAPSVILLTIFHYLPLPGIVIAFAKFNLSGFQEWVGFDNFRHIFGLNNFWRAFGNNWLYVAMNYLISFPASIILAILFNEVRVRWYKKFVQK